MKVLFDIETTSSVLSLKRSGKSSYALSRGKEPKRHDDCLIVYIERVVVFDEWKKILYVNVKAALRYYGYETMQEEK